ncbi:RcnB family protein [Dyella flava]|uniref:RcnB family protein n=1 Tax=Dyella flava TaxID=1920170 RepID=A0ABS2K1Z1_9GAMM|nr:RcnB family protein [Dyella flava]MBM7125271.1 RcnB family protein [Dyella flava]
MNVYARVSLVSLAFVSFATFAQPREVSGRDDLQYYHTGQPVPAYMLADDNVVLNYQHYHLDKPMLGYEWVRGIEGEYLLVSTKSAILRRIEYRPNVPVETALRD